LSYATEEDEHSEKKIFGLKLFRIMMEKR